MSALRILAAATFVAILAAVPVMGYSDEDHHSHNAWHWNDFSLTGDETLRGEFEKCICVNATNGRWCQNDDSRPDDHHFWSRSGCRKFFGTAFLWTIPVVFAMIIFIIFPFFFAMSRILCNCCGGRQPTYGCCCPVSNRIVSDDPNFKRPYSKCAIATAKIMSIIVLAGYVSFAVHAILNSHDVDRAFVNTVTGVNTTFSEIATPVETALNIIRTAPNITSEQYREAADVDGKVNWGVRHVYRTMHDTIKYSHVTFGIFMKIAGAPILLLILLNIFSLCNIRGWPVSLLLCVFSLTVVIVAFPASGAKMLHESSQDLICNSTGLIDGGVQKTLTNIVKSAGGCENGNLLNATNTTLWKVRLDICNAGLQALCQSDAVCPGLSTFCQTEFTDDAWFNKDYFDFDGVFENSYLAQYPNISLASCGKHTNMMHSSTAVGTCIELDAKVPYRHNAAALFAAVKKQESCSTVADIIARSPAQTPLCIDLATSSLHLWRALTACAVILVICIPVSMYGSKRFVRYSKQSSHPRDSSAVPLVQGDVVRQAPADAYMAPTAATGLTAPLVVSSGDVPMPAPSNHVNGYGTGVDEYPVKPPPQPEV